MMTLADVEPTAWLLRIGGPAVPLCKLHPQAELNHAIPDRSNTIHIKRGR